MSNVFLDHPTPGVIRKAFPKKLRALGDSTIPINKIQP